MEGRGRSWKGIVAEEASAAHLDQGRSWKNMDGHGRSWKAMEGHGKAKSQKRQPRHTLMPSSSAPSVEVTSPHEPSPHGVTTCAHATGSHQQPPEAIRQSEAIGSHQKPSAAISSHQQQSEATGSHRKPSEAIGSHQKLSPRRAHLAAGMELDAALVVAPRPLGARDLGGRR